MKVIVQIPCLNEETTLPLVFAKMPRQIPGVDNLEFMVIDDGSTDRTVEVARELGVQHFVSHARNMGLGRSFHDGVQRALELGADILVNTDGDNQYPSESIAALIQPILVGHADIVIADRQVKDIAHFSPAKKLLQKLGSRVVNAAAATDIPDAASGFRAYSRESLVRLNTVTRFSYCMETIIQAGNKRLSIVSIPVRTNPKTRESRLFSRASEHVFKSGAAIARSFLMYRPLALFMSAGTLLTIIGLVPFLRFIYFQYFAQSSTGVSRHIQSLLAGSVLLIAAFLSFALGIIAELIRINRSLIEDGLEIQKRQLHPHG
ncbi:MAG: glycosyltransferase family 2 protein [Actinomycetota bacterium]|jgi:glycosyltransferase involved in cell wall biosynthesis